MRFRGCGLLIKFLVYMREIQRRNDSSNLFCYENSTRKLMRLVVNSNFSSGRTKVIRLCSTKDKKKSLYVTLTDTSWRVSTLSVSSWTSTSIGTVNVATVPITTHSSCQTFILIWKRKTQGVIIIEIIAVIFASISLGTIIIINSKKTLLKVKCFLSLGWHEGFPC